jgi:hypothetical protein
LTWLRIGQVVGTCECGDEPLGSINVGNFWTSWGPHSFSGRTLFHVVWFLVGWFCCRSVWST